MKKHINTIGFTALLAIATPAPAQSATTAPLDAEMSNPVKMGWMTGSPVPADKQIRIEDGSFWSFPQYRWSFSHWRELLPSVAVSRGSGPVSRLPRAELKEIDAVTFIPIGAKQSMTWEQSLAVNYTDGIIVLHKGQIVYERYFGALRPDGQHIAMSVTKSFIGTIAAMLVAEGRLDADATVASYIPELAGTGFADATVRQLLDMTTGIAFDEVYADPNSAFWNYARSANFLNRPSGYNGPASVYDYLKTVDKQGEHGEGFIYRSANTEVIGWLIRRVTGKSAAVVLSDRIWSHLGAEQDAYLQLDPSGNAFVGAGLNLGLRDLARFGEMMRKGGRFNGKQIVPSAVVAAIARGGDPRRFDRSAYPALPGWSYANQWWFTHNEHNAYLARGILGQTLYIDPKAEMIIARFSSPPVPGDAPSTHPTSLPAYHALAKHLMGKRGRATGT